MKEADNWRKQKNSTRPGREGPGWGTSEGVEERKGKGKMTYFYNILKRVKHICINKYLNTKNQYNKKG